MRETARPGRQQSTDPDRSVERGRDREPTRDDNRADGISLDARAAGGRHDPRTILRLQASHGNRFVRRMLGRDGDRTGNRAPVPALQRIPGAGGDIGRPRDPATGEVATFPELGHLLSDSAGWVKNLVTIVGYDVLAPVTGNSARASEHLYHNMFGSGEPVEVTRKWVMAAPKWREAYRELLDFWAAENVWDAKTRYLEGETTGSDTFSHTVSGVSSLPNKFLGEGTDQFYGSGSASFTVSGSYSWRPVRDTPEYVLVEMSDIKGSFYDRYDWHHKADSGEFSRQERGWYKSFDLTAEWDEGERVGVYEVGSAGAETE